MRSTQVFELKSIQEYFKQGRINRQEHTCALSVFIWPFFNSPFQSQKIESIQRFTNMNYNHLVRADRNSS